MSDNIDIDYVGLKQIQDTFKKLEKLIPKLYPVSKDRAEKILILFQTYPPPLRYIRTGKLAASMRKKIDKTDDSIHTDIFSVGARNKNGQNYEHFVRVEGEQAIIHENRWDTEVEILSGQINIIVDEHFMVIDDILK